MQIIAFLKNIGLAGGFLFIVVNGTKEWSIDKKKNTLDFKLEQKKTLSNFNRRGFIFFL